jgi:uncharacterized protein YjbI with pentapeptide repeats
MPDGDRLRRDRGPRVLTGARLTQPVLESLQALHFQFVRGVRNGRKLVLRRCDLGGLDLSSMDLTGAELLACNFSRARLRDTNLRLAQLYAANFDSADLLGTDLEKADLRAAAFENADLTDAKLLGADLRDCAFIDEKTNELGGAISSSFRAATLRGTNLANSKLKNAIFNVAVLDRVDFSHAHRDRPFQHRPLADPGRQHQGGYRGIDP